ncbi:hypothetical protein WICPIJ_009913 [Wickerhamomyces pijperi]|uniref:Serine aminopeptidase S33 domain-containing protein n=1 Tax=Wickerhamomyces pijperi TaxID=599730 RepID=A0A9P8PKQ6_WICPI|nr:hypothetical protein WICPIJ_009913 [Wickerhamomyces pijperi]
MSTTTSDISTTEPPNGFPHIYTNKSIHGTVEFDGVKFKTVFWVIPEGKEVKGRVLFIHGFSDYHQSYSKFYDLISQKGYELYHFDQRGAGETSPGDAKGITNEYHVFRDLDHFIELNLKELEQKPNKNTKLYLGGHSMGGGIALNYGVYGTHRAKIAGIFCTGPLILLDSKTRPNFIKFSILKLAMNIVPNMRIDTGLVSDYITSDDEWREYLVSDPIINPLLSSLRQGHDFIARGEKLVKKDHVAKFKKDLPVLVIHGADDKINQPAGSEKFCQLAKQVGVEDVELKIIKNARHTLFCEKPEIYEETENTILQWLDKHSY